MAYRRDIKYDYKLRRQGGWTRHRRRTRRLAVRLGILGVLACLLAASTLYLARLNHYPPFAGSGVAASDEQTTIALTIARPADSSPADAGYPYPFEPPIAPGGKQAGRSSDAADLEWHEVTVRPGDNMSLIFSRLGLKYAELHKIIGIGETTSGLKSLRPGQKIRIGLADEKIQKLIHEESLLRTLEVVRAGDHFEAAISVSEPERIVRTAAGVIDSSLFLSGQAAGLSDNLIMQLADIFGWDIDFVLDIRKGDHFAVVFEEYFKGDYKIRDGAILAAEFVNREKTFRAIRYVDENGAADYYADSGAAMRKAFLRTPVKFSRISSRFNLSRRHPILNTIRAHKGVDYAAPHGTPVKATGDGKIEFIGTNGGYGKMIVLRHGGSYSTAYAHLSRFARGMKQGKAVKQNQVIAYVGQTGLATGPHLHYEFRINGVHHNPLKVPFPKAEPLPEKYLADFRLKAEPLLAQLDALDLKLSSVPVLADSKDDDTQDAAANSTLAARH